ncbi:L-lactate permease [Candidatus Bathyarchaeota archaeon]|nr:L-lactate permease [Candidatus Bathyarchaeota archaeon]
MRFPIALTILAVLVLAGAFLSLRFVLAIFALIVVFVGIVQFRQSGATMAVVGLIVSLMLAIGFFNTDPLVALGAAIYGIFKSFGITISVLATMLMIFLMREVGALQIISTAIKRAATTKEQQALFLGVGFGSFATSLGVVTPSLFPPLLVAMGFSPFAAIAISVLGYNATTSYALLSVPISLPADVFRLDVFLFAYKVNIFLPVVAVLVSIAMLWIIGGKSSVKKGIVPAILTGLTIAFSCLIFGLLHVPIMLIGVLAGLVSMAVLYLHQRLVTRPTKAIGSIDRGKTIRALSPWLILIALALVVSMPQVTDWMRHLDGPAFWIFDKPLDLDAFAQVYTWIFAATILSLLILKPTRDQLGKTMSLWIRRIWQPFIAYALFFGVAYVMAWSAMAVSNGKLVPTSEFAVLNMNNVIGLTLAATFGAMFVFVAPWLGLFGAVVGGSEASSNVMFFPIQHKAAEGIGLTEAGQNSSAFMTIYGSHANGGGIASAITPSKINNAAVTIGAETKLESEILRSHVPLVLVITFIVGLLTALFIALGI